MFGLFRCRFAGTIDYGCSEAGVFLDFRPTAGQFLQNQIGRIGAFEWVTDRSLKM